MPLAIPNLEELVGTPSDGAPAIPRLEELVAKPAIPRLEELVAEPAIPRLEELVAEPVATPGDIESLQKSGGKLETGRLVEKLGSQLGSITDKAATLMSQPGLSTYGKDKIKEAVDLYSPPVFMSQEKRKAITGRQQTMLDKLGGAKGTGERYEGGMKEGVKRGITSTLDALDFVFNMPNRVVSETVDAARKRLTWATQGGEGELPEYHPWDAAMREPNASRGLDQTYQEAYKQSVGGRDLTEAERLSFLAAGVISDIGVGGKIGQAIAPFKRVPASRAISENVEGALTRAGLKAPAAHVAYMGETASSGKSLPERIRFAREELEKTAYSLGASPEEARRMDIEFIGRIGNEGKYLEKKGWGAEVGKRISKPSPERLAEVIAPTDTTVPFGALTKPGAKRGLGSSWAWDRGAPQGAGDIIRQNQGRGLAGIAQSEKDAQGLGRMFPTPERGEQVMRWRDASSTKSEADKWMRQAESFEKVTGTPPSGRLVRAREEVVRRFDELELEGAAPKTPQEYEALKFMKRQFSEFEGTEKASGISMGHVEEYLPRVETGPSKDLAFKIYPKGSSGGPGFTKERLPWETGVTLDGTPLHEFHKHPAAIYAARAKAHNLVMTAANNEGDILKHYGKKVARYTPEERAAAKAQGLEVWRQKFGPDAGAEYLLDENAARLLEKTTSREEIGRFGKIYDDAHNWLKGRMTVLRPGFVMRNFFGGNLYNMWLGDVDIMTGLNDASKVMGVKQARHFGPATKLEIGTERLFSKGLTGKPLGKIGGKTVEEWIGLLDDNKVLSPGQVAVETGTAGLTAPTSRWSKWYNPGSRHNVAQRLIGGGNRALENLSKVAVFMDRIKKGYTPREAADAVAKTLFNYDELSAVLGSKTIKRTMSFPIWQYKNMGMQFSSMLSRPDKFSQALTARTGIQNIDPLDPKELALASAIPPEMRRAEPFFIPKARGSEGERRFFLEGGVSPMGSLGMSGLDKLARGEVKDWGDGVMMSLADLLSPVPSYAFKETVRAITGQRPTMFGQVKKSTGEEKTWAPKPIAFMAEAMRKYAPAAWDYVSDKRDWITPATSIVAGKNKQIGYKVDAGFQGFLETIDPGLSILRRLLPSFPKEEDYKTWTSIVFGYKDVNLTKKKAMRWQVKAGTAAEEKLNIERRRQESTGVKTNESNPFQGVQY